MKRRKRIGKNSQPITKGQLNRVIDTFVHPLFKKDKGYIWIDTFLHGLLEQNPRISIEKFAKYNLPKLLKRKKRKQADYK